MISSEQIQKTKEKPKHQTTFVNYHYDNQHPVRTLVLMTYVLFQAAGCEVLIDGEQNWSHRTGPFRN